VRALCPHVVTLVEQDLNTNTTPLAMVRRRVRALQRSAEVCGRDPWPRQHAKGPRRGGPGEQGKKEVDT
jgi:hypothetical protein